MSFFCKLRQSRLKWKTTATGRGKIIKNLKKKLCRYIIRLLKAEKSILLLKEENTILRSIIEENFPITKQTATIIDFRSLCVSLVIKGIVPFRAVPRILNAHQEYENFPIPIPHFTSVINWSLRVGVAVYQTIAPVSFPWVAIIDCSIDVGTRKALVVLRVPMDAIQKNNGAIGLQHCQCVGIKVSSKWNGPLVNDALAEFFKIAGNPVAILKDGGSDLEYGVHLYREATERKNIVVIDDVGHVVANALKSEFAKQTSFEKFLKIVKNGAARIRQTDLAWLLPPKIRTKGRFQGISRVAKWAMKIVDSMGGQGRAEKNSELNSLRKSFTGLAQIRPFVELFSITCIIVEQFLKILKLKGLTQDTYREAKELLQQIPTEKVRTKLQSWLDKHILIQCRLAMGQRPLIVSSDAIESLFGKFKTIIQRNPQAELNRLIYIIPLLCGTYAKNDISTALHACSHQQMLDQIEKTVPETLRQQRNRILKRKRENGPEMMPCECPRDG